MSIWTDSEKPEVDFPLPGVLVLFANGQRRAYFLGDHAWEYVTLREPRGTGGPPNNEVQRTMPAQSDGASPLNSVFGEAVEVSEARGSGG